MPDLKTRTLNKLYHIHGRTATNFKHWDGAKLDLKFWRPPHWNPPRRPTHEELRSVVTLFRLAGVKVKGWDDE